MKGWTALRWAALLGLPVACAEPSAPPRPGAANAQSQVIQLALEPVATGLASPVHLTSPPRDARLFIVERGGTIRIVKNGLLLANPFLDISHLVTVRVSAEQGLLGLVFHPQYATNGRFFVNYTDSIGDSNLVEYRVSAHPNRADPATARRILFVDQPAPNHNGGALAFGKDGYLYVAFGDGGSGARANGQRLNTLLGKILRIDVDGAEPYEVPPDNPFVGLPGVRPEIWHLGLRNPWRMTFDRAADRMYIGDVGASQYEEINVAPTGRGGLNFGWSVMEGPACFPAGPCSPAGLKQPFHYFEHGEDHCSVTGGFVYRGRRIPELRGVYFFADFCSGVVQSFRPVMGNVTELRDWSADIGVVPGITSFGEDHRGELYVVRLNGNVYRIVAQ